MASFVRIVQVLVGALAFLWVVAATEPANAQQTQINPTASSVKEEQLLQELNRIQGRISIPDQRAATLEQPAGRDWREFRNVTLRWVGGIAILGMLALIVAFYLTRGMVRIEHGRSGRVIVRFSAFERFVHWMTATCFIVLAITGLNMTFGRSLLLPLVGLEGFAEWSQWAKYAHDYLAFPFTIGVALIFLMWVGGNIPERLDIDWLKRGGGLFGHDHPPAHRFNAGQKAIYWIVVLGGGAVAATGYQLMFPFYVSGIEGMQTAQMVHAVVALLFMAAMLAHVYIGTIGMEGAFEAMGSGTVDVNWAKEHHSLWLDEEQNAPRPARADNPRLPAFAVEGLAYQFGQAPLLKPHGASRKGFLGGFLDMIEQDEPEGSRDDGGRAGEQKSSHGSSPQEIHVH
jgi:formate dehydrogenase subunit gamma